MPRLQFEYKVTVANVIQIALILVGGLWAYFTLVDDTAQASKDANDLKPVVISLQNSTQSLRDTDATFNTRLTVVESRAETRDQDMQKMSASIDKLSEALQALASTSRENNVDIGYIRRWIEELKREQAK